MPEWNAYSRFRLFMDGYVITLGGTGDHLPKRSRNGQPFSISVKRRWCFALQIAGLEIRAPEPSNDVRAWGQA